MNSVRLLELLNICFTIYYGFHSFREHKVFRNLFSAFPVLTVGFLWLLLFTVTHPGFSDLLNCCQFTLSKPGRHSDLRICLQIFLCRETEKLWSDYFGCYEFTSIWWNCLLQLYFTKIVF